MPTQSTTLDAVFQALADPTRRAIVDRLSRGPMSVGELAKPFPMSLPAVMQHLQMLEASGMVRSQKVGRVRTCRVERAPLAAAERWIASRREAWERHFDRLEAYLQETDTPKKRKKAKKKP
jgi:DNA-binding transcriptional ArsR family regulator